VLGIWQAEKAIIDQQFDNGEITEIDRNRMYQEVLSEAFYDGLAMFKLGSGSTAKFIPSINWAIRWEGLEEWSLWDDFVKRATVDHTYTSSYQENAQLTDLGRNVQSQNIQYGFQPLVGVNVTFDEEKFDGILTATFRWSHTKSFMINNSARTVISSQETNEITAQGSYTMKGFTFPLFGIDFENDFEWSFLATYKSNRRATFDILADEGEYQGENEGGRVLNGNTQIILEPRARYSISNRLTASFFVRYEGTFTEGAAQPGFHTTQVGLDIRLSIAGGR
jgi:cell surface protein SprA